VRAGPPAHAVHATLCRAEGLTFSNDPFLPAAVCTATDALTAPRAREGSRPRGPAPITGRLERPHAVKEGPIRLGRRRPTPEAGGPRPLLAPERLTSHGHDSRNPQLLVLFKSPGSLWAPAPPQSTAAAATSLRQRLGAGAGVHHCVIHESTSFKPKGISHALHRATERCRSVIRRWR
jgi:hypothetical protein